ncbi:MAG: alpha/beta hydrolase [SAR324 cluster bacterium]|nr:alpha/beta hydrolase [SAR324 cluster bacterium]
MTVPTFRRNGYSGDALVFLHGIGGNADSWQPQLSAFGKSFQAIAWNMPGYGDCPPVQDLTFPALAFALEKLLDELEFPEVHLVGHSLGGMVAQEFLLERQHRVKSLVLYATSPAFGRADGEWQQKFIRHRLEPLEQGGTMKDVARQMMTSLLGEDPDPEGVKLAQECIADCKPQAYRKALQCLLGFDRRSHLPEISLPTLLLAGENDPAAPSAMMKKMASKIPGSRFCQIAKAGHLIHLEQADSFNKTVAQFLESSMG